MSIIFKTPEEICHHLATQLRAHRLHLNLSQKTLAERSGVSYSVIKKFERQGQISLQSLLKLALALGCLENFEELFSLPKVASFQSLDELLKNQDRKRGRE